MIPAAFEYHRPKSVNKAIALLQKYGFDAKILSGGHSLIPAMKLRLAQPAHVIDISRIRGLDKLRGVGDAVVIGALATHYTVSTSRVSNKKALPLAQAASTIGDVQVRNVGTIGGALAHADPASDYPAAILATDATIVVQGPGGEREIPADDFFVDLFETDLKEDEIIVAVRVPAAAANSGGAYTKFPNPASGYAVVGCAAVVTVDDGKCTGARVAFNGLANCAFRDTATEEALIGTTLDDAAITSAAEAAGAGITFLSDTFASADYRAHLAGIYAKRAIAAATAGCDRP